MTMRSGEAKAEALASPCRDRSNTSLAPFSSCERRAPTATGAPASPANPVGSGVPMSVKTARAASRPVRAIPFPPGTKPWCRTDTAMVQLPGCRLVRAVPHPKAANKQADETLYDELTRLLGTHGFPAQEAVRLA